MKNFLYISILLNLCGAVEECNSQNLVPNNNFEDTLFCPYLTDWVFPMVGWTSYGNSVDCFHACSPMVNVPDSPFGYQNAHSGNGMIGLITTLSQYSIGWPNYREYAGATLLSNLQIGQKYFISFYMNCAGYLPGYEHMGSNKMGLRFSTVVYDSLAPPQPNNFAHLYTDSILTDTTQWYKVSGSFIADSSYSYVVLGNFFDTLQTDTVVFGGPPFTHSAAYYYIDDICVSLDSLTCMGPVGFTETRLGLLTNIYPNPFKDELNVDMERPDIWEILLYNSIGEKLIHTKIGSSSTINTFSIPYGIYVCLLRNLTGLEERFILVKI